MSLNISKIFGYIHVGMSKSTKNISTLEWCRDTFGGFISGFQPLSEKNPNHSDALVWSITCGPAIAFCNTLAAHSHLKADQLETAASFPSEAVWRRHSRGVRLIRGEEQHVCDSSKEAAKIVGCTPQAICYALAGPRKCKGWCLEPYSRMSNTELRQSVRHIWQELKRLKRVPDVAISRPLPLPYVSGLFDAEGSLSIQNSDCRVSISQKDPAIRTALQHQFGGRSHGISWYVNGSWREFLELIAPYSIEKRKQIELVLGMNGNGPEVKALLDPLQRNKRKASQAAA